ncbi:MAG: hypothetical protein R3B93_20495 [Bacteroidia bacterium]
MGQACRSRPMFSKLNQHVVTLSDPGWVRWSGYTHYEWQSWASAHKRYSKAVTNCGGTGKILPS